MNPKIKEYVGIAIVVILLLVLGAIWKYVNAYAGSMPPSANFAVTGEGKVTAIPDVAQFSFGITTEGGKDISVLQKTNTEKANAAIAYVKSEGVEAIDIETQNYDIQPRYTSYSCAPTPYLPADSRGVSVAMPAKCPPSEITGYTITQTISVKIRDFNKIGDIISGVTSKGANNVSGLNFITNDLEGARTAARAKAMENGKKQAESLAKAGKFRLGRIISVQQNNNYYPSPYPYNRNLEVLAKTGADMAQSAPAIEAGSDEIVEQVTIVYEIK